MVKRNPRASQQSDRHLDNDWDYVRRCQIIACLSLHGISSFFEDPFRFLGVLRPEGHDEPDTGHDESDTRPVEFTTERGDLTEYRCDSDITSDRFHSGYRWFYVPKPGDDRDAVDVSDLQTADLTDDGRKLDRDQPERKHAADDCDVIRVQSVAKVPFSRCTCEAGRAPFPAGRPPDSDYPINVDFVVENAKFSQKAAITQPLRGSCYLS